MGDFKLNVYNCYETSDVRFDGTIIFNGTKITQSFCSTDNCNKGEHVDNNKLWCNYGPFDSDPSKTKGKQSCSGTCVVRRIYFFKSNII